MLTDLGGWNHDAGQRDRGEHRLEAIGMTLQGKVSVLGSKDSGTLILKVRGARFAMGRGITQKITVEPA